jgi:hypothetical protein
MQVVISERLKMSYKIDKDKARRYPITEEQFNQLFDKKLISWGTVKELPPYLPFPGQIRVDDTIGVMVSGTASNPQLIEDELAVAGIDLLVHETKPKKYPKSKEKESNAYHYIVLKVEDENYPYEIYGPHDGAGADLKHWFGVDDLNKYV